MAKQPRSTAPTTAPPKREKSTKKATAVKKTASAEKAVRADPKKVSSTVPPLTEEERKAKKREALRAWRAKNKDRYARYLKAWRAERDAKAGKTSSTKRKPVSAPKKSKERVTDEPNEVAAPDPSATSPGAAGSAVEAEAE